MKVVRLIIMMFSVSVFTGFFVLSCSQDDIAEEETVMEFKVPDNAVVKSSGNSATVEWEVEWIYWLDVECDGFTDYLYGPVTAHVVTHYRNGEPISTIYHTTGVIESANTDEVFIVNEVSRDNFAESYIDFQFNIRGDMGSHYIGRMTWDYEPGNWDEGIMITRKFICPGN